MNAEPFAEVVVKVLVPGVLSRIRPSANADIHQATREYERWMRGRTRAITGDLHSKRAQMRADLFLFLRGSFYRWAQLWPDVCGDLCHAPEVLSVGDLHVNSSVTWRDAEGRTCWGVDDFDEAYPLPYTNDLVRLAASLKIVIDSGTLSLTLRDGCAAVLDGYEKTLKMGGCPFVLAEDEPQLEKLGMESIKPPQGFWKKMNELPASRGSLPRDAKRALGKSLPDLDCEYKVVRRSAGHGSLGRERYVAIAKWQDGGIAREAKAMLPSACAWLEGKLGDRESHYQEAIDSAVRSHDPYQFITERLAHPPVCRPIRVQLTSLTCLRGGAKRCFCMRWGAKPPMCILDPGAQ